ncbi:MAG: hypothetical protein U0414_38530 [Polyangiaceae bacterium]
MSLFLNDNHDDDEPSVAERCCVDCGAKAPKTQTAHTLISSKHGWRLSRAATGDGYAFHWRCPRCWVAHKTRGHDSHRD